MHARIDELLSLRDGEPVAAEVAGHVGACVSCAAELRRLHAIRARLQALPQALPGGAERWRVLEERLDAVQSVRRRGTGTGALAAAASIAALALLASLRMQDRAAEPAEAFAGSGAAAVETGSPSVDELQRRSLELEQLLAAMPGRPAIERAATALPIETIEAQVQWVDHRLSEADVSGAPPEETRRLWNDRIELMDSLVRLRLVETQRMTL